ncbi:hypothetical protein JW879_00520 [candidate division WOR-3 bacterium]|nr:hypothetical protein [candidate division WOR-3 bacterium]
MKKKIWTKKIPLSKAKDEDIRYYSSLTPSQKLSIVQELREEESKRQNEDRKRLRRVLRLVKQK